MTQCQSIREGASQTRAAFHALCYHCLHVFRRHFRDDLLKQGIAAPRAGRKDEARQKLLLVVELDDQNEQGWLWLSGVVEADRGSARLPGNVLALNPDNAAAQKGLRGSTSMRQPRGVNAARIVRPTCPLPETSARPAINPC